ncbi:MAG TPA: ABC transporter substrate-binding protein [Phycicoccus sp.]|jgi:multiple sugar transport system substrate-binding protein|nr:ABC transporter substrate-binding protein [Phycicoccus sp.]HQH07396.1 ABC transporter substrate-binding protein [Phycicoccus sp.]HQY95525.1 ABC transporter substrate-binding protein [Phycicoccus sp.]HRA43891.1 ABC transporter substrate-binding protein [Phycicoccus sp.]
MTRPATHEEYLARLVPPSVRGVDRRTLLRASVGAGALLGLPALAACSSSSSGGAASGGAAATGTVTLGSNQSDAVPKAAIQSVMDAFQKANDGLTVKVNTVDHNTFQENINNYLQGSPDDVFMWFAGYRMRFFASKGLAGDISDIWPIDGLTDALKKSSTGDDGKQYFVPSTYYPWAFYYRKSVWAEKGYAVPKTLDELKTLGAKMKADGLDPIAFGDKDGWPAMGTFDQINMRVNGYDFHINLMAGKEAWNGPEVKKTFDTWRGLLDIHQADSLGRTWQEAAQSLQQKKSGMYLLGMFVAQQFEKGAEQDDLDFFTFPEVDSTIGADAIEAPIDGYMMAKRPKNEAGAKKLLSYVGGAEAQGLAVKSDPSVIATNDKTDTSGYTALQKKAVEFVASAKSIAQFMDRDTRPDFASTVMIPAIQDFIKNPADIDGLVNSIEKQKQSIFAS